MLPKFTPHQPADMPLYNEPRALEDFHRARRKAAIQDILARFGGKSNQLLSYEEVRRKLRGIESATQELREIPLKAIGGSVGRYTDFNRSFLPRKSISAQRWARVKAVFESATGLDPIEVYQIGEVYFVQDGNHRVSIARRMGSKQIQAYVKVVKTKVPLESDVQPDDLIIKAEYAEFLEATHIDVLYPDVDFRVTATGRYQTMLQQIEAIQFSLELERGQKVQFKDAVAHWYNEIYFPFIYIIRTRNLLQDFPNRTETDLFLWILKYRRQLSKTLDLDVSPDVAVSGLVSDAQQKRGWGVKRILKAITPSWLKAGPRPGMWREEHLARQQGRMFSDILVVLNSGSAALAQAIEIAILEGSRICGLYVMPEDASGPDHASPAASQIQAGFEKQCKEKEIPFIFIHDTGSIAESINLRAPFTDLLVLPMKLTLEASPSIPRVTRLETLIQDCCTPILVTNNAVSPLKRALIGYDGSPKAEEALYLAAYIARFWELSLTIVTGLNTRQVKSDTQQKAQEYLQRYSVEAQFIETPNPPADAILDIAEQHECDLIVIGGYGATPVVKSVTGSVVDDILGEFEKSILICR
jgi:nucleotide-binding universal stress UspA family protein